MKKLDQLESSSRLHVTLAMLAMFVPATLLAAKIMGRKAGMLSSVAGHLRKRWLVRCVVLALVANLVWIILFAVSSAVFHDHTAAHAGTKAAASTSGESLGPFLAFLVLLVPIQAAGEEYLFRGTLMQLGGRFVRPWPVAVVISAVAFTAAHGALSPASATLFAMGLVLAWLTVRTGGLEAGIGQHVANNVIIFVARALANGGESIDTNHLNDNATWRGVALQIATLAFYAYLVVRSYKRRPELAQSLPPGPDEIEQHAPERRARVEHADHGGDAEALPPQQEQPRG